MRQPHHLNLHVGPPEDGRRGFLAKCLSLVCGGLATFTPAAVGVWAFFDPLRRRAAAARFIPVTELHAIPADGLPRQFPVVTDRMDAWTGFAAEPIGAVYLRRAKGSDTVEALSATCPHAGCFVALDGPRHCFRCPCHNSNFTFDGGIVSPSPSPRPMDTLECRVAKNGQIEVKWQKYQAGIANKVAQQ